MSNADDPVGTFVVCPSEVVVDSLQRAHKSRSRSGCRRERTPDFSERTPVHGGVHLVRCCEIREMRAKSLGEMFDKKSLSLLPHCFREDMSDAWFDKG